MRPFLLLSLLVAAPALLADESKRPDPRQPYTAAKSRPVTYDIEMAFVVTPPYKAKLLRVWVPVPPSDAGQEVSKSRFSTFPTGVEPRVGSEKTHGNTFAYFEFKSPQGAQIIRHTFTVKAWQLDWDVDPAKVAEVKEWPASFDPYLRGEPLIPVDERFRKLAGEIVPEKAGSARDMRRVMGWVNRTLTYSHEECSLQASAVFALDKRKGHCSDYHGLCNALGRSLGVPTRMTYGINPVPKNSPSHCKFEAFLPPYGWVSFDVSEAQQMAGRIGKDKSLTPARREALAKAAAARLARGFRDNTWFVQTRGSHYDLEPPAARKVAVVRTLYAEADGVAYPEPDPANPKVQPLAWMTAHRYRADREVASPFQDYASLGE